MLQCARLVLVVLFAFVSQLFAQTTITPTTTLSAETGNNTSAASTFAGLSNGDLPAGNVSKENVHKLLNSDLSAKVYAHFMGWWGSSSHINIGYDSSDPTQVHNQISDMMSRGIDGVIIDWYGPGNTRVNQASLNVKQDAETRGGQFEFAIMEDQGAVRTCAYTSGCDVTQALINDLNYIVNTFTGSPAYMRVNGQPVIYTFDVEMLPNIDWTRVMANIGGNPKLVLHNNQGFTKWYSSGSYAWVVVNSSNQNDWGQAYLDNFYATSQSYPGMMVYAGTWKGFNDTAASWGQNRIMNQNCGQVWLQTFGEIGKYFTGTQAQGVQIVTWNDYEEGTEIETGVDNCVGVSASATSDGTISWNINGQENTIDHYTIFISTDGQNLMKLADLATGTYSYSLSAFGFAGGNYTAYVKAVGKPSIQNKISAPVPVTLQIPFTVNVASPSNGGSVNLMPHFVASTTSPSPVTAMRIYVDNVGVYTVYSATLDTTLTLTPGAHYVVVQAWNQAGQVAKTPLNITVADQPPTAMLSVTPATGTAPVTVNASTLGSTDADGTIASSSIDFGDGTAAAAATATHVYSTPGTYTVRGTVTDNGGATATASATVTVAAPAFTINPLSPANGATIASPVHFSATTTSYTTVTLIRIYVDNIDVHDTATASLDTTLTLSPGPHSVVLQAWNQGGQIAKASLNISVANVPPVAALSVTPTSGTAPLAVSASAAASTDSDGTITTYAIDFGDGTVTYAKTATHTYANPGIYTVTAKVTDNYGASSTAQATVTVSPASDVWIITPQMGAYVGTSVRVAALAGSPYGIVATRVYVDNIAVYDVSASSVDVTITMALGSHRITVQAWDTRGKVYKSSVTVKVQ